MRPARILVIEDDIIVARTIERSLRSSEFEILLANRGATGLAMAQQEPPDLVILDIIMPEMDGYAVCRAFRGDERLAHIPILFLTAKVKIQDKIAGFLAGGDDYLCKPFNIDELILRVKAILRRTLRQRKAALAGEAGLAANFAASEGGAAGMISASRHLTVGGYTLDTHTFELHTPRRGKVRLTPLQFDLLYHLMLHPGETFSPSRLLDEVWDYPAGKGSPDLVRVHIKTLRERIEDDPQAPHFLCTIPGRGYTVNPGGEAAMCCQGDHDP